MGLGGLGCDDACMGGGEACMGGGPCSWRAGVACADGWGEGGGTARLESGVACARGGDNAGPQGSGMQVVGEWRAGSVVRRVDPEEESGGLAGDPRCKDPATDRYEVGRARRSGRISSPGVVVAAGLVVSALGAESRGTESHRT